MTGNEVFIIWPVLRYFYVIGNEVLNDRFWGIFMTSNEVLYDRFWGIFMWPVMRNFVSSQQPVLRYIVSSQQPVLRYFISSQQLVLRYSTYRFLTTFLMLRFSMLFSMLPLFFLDVPVSMFLLFFSMFPYSMLPSFPNIDGPAELVISWNWIRLYFHTLNCSKKFF